MTDDAPRQRALPIDPDAGFEAMSAAEFAAIRETIGTQHEVAVEMQTARRTLGRWERGDRPVPGVAAACIKLLAKEAAERRAATIAAAQAMGEQIA